MDPYFDATDARTAGGLAPELGAFLERRAPGEPFRPPRTDPPS
jgi:hypothetical protein